MKPFALALLLALSAATSPYPLPAAETFTGKFFRGEGDVEYLQLLDISRRMYEADPEFQNMAMLYMPSWNGLVEGPTWGAWWVQNSYGTTFCSLPFYQEPFVTFLQNSQDLWFNNIGDGQRSFVWNGKDSWVPPDGCLMDCANETWAMHRQGDGRVAIHDWGMEFTAGGALLQSELLLISREPEAIARYLPKLERCANFIETRRDPKNNLFLAGPAGNLLAPSYAGYKRPDGTYGMAYLTGLSVTYIAFLDRLVELQKMANKPDAARRYTERRAAARQGLDQLATEDGYFIRSLDPDGTKHGVYGAEKHGYFEASPNHDAICFRVVDDPQSARIYQKIASIPGLRPYSLIVPNCPSYDDMYEAPQGLWGFGTWVNGGHWTTCEARMMMGYYRVGAYADARRAMDQIMTFARQFRLDNPLVKFGSDVYQPGEPINLTYDAFGAPAGFIRGLFEYVYRADSLTLFPHIPTGISHLEQHFPIRFGSKRLYLATTGVGQITAVTINDRPCTTFEAGSVRLDYEALPAAAAIQILRGGATARSWTPSVPRSTLPNIPVLANWPGPDPVEIIAGNELALRIGADSNASSRFQGDIAFPTVFRRALSGDEISALTKSPSGLNTDPDIVAQWVPGTTATSTAPNAAGNAGPAKVVGQVEVRDVPMGKAFHLGGEGYLEVPNSPALALKRGGTWFALICPDKTAGRLIDKCPVGASTGYTFDTYPGNALRLITDAGAISFDAQLPVGQWTAVAATVDTEGTSRLYLNGKEVNVAKRSLNSLDIASLLAKGERLRRFVSALESANLVDCYEATHARLTVQTLASAHAFIQDTRSGKRATLPPRSQAAAERLYLSTAAKLNDGLEKFMSASANSAEPKRKQAYALWRSTEPAK